MIFVSRLNLVNKRNVVFAVIYRKINNDMGESFKKIVEMTESVSSTVSKIGKDMASELEKANKVLQDSVRRIEYFVQEGKDFSELLQGTLAALHNDFNGVLSEAQNVIESSRNAVFKTISDVTADVHNALDDKSSPGKLITLKNKLFAEFEKIKNEQLAQIEHLTRLIALMVENFRKLVEAIITSANRLKSVSDKTMTALNKRVEEQLTEIVNVSNDLGESCSDLLNGAIDQTSHEYAVVLDQVQTMTNTSTSNVPTAKVFLSMGVEQTKDKFQKSLDVIKDDVSNSIKSIEESSNKLLKSV
ncbi:hypothetical protein FQA39_LY03295 [Lamprigera yunnana]|nr:hypothetical protein FQA39_LY03295 [Lamprigera yunnana]